MLSVPIQCCGALPLAEGSWLRANFPSQGCSASAMHVSFDSHHDTFLEPLVCTFVDTWLSASILCWTLERLSIVVAISQWGSSETAGTDSQRVSVSEERCNAILTL